MLNTIEAQEERTTLRHIVALLEQATEVVRAILVIIKNNKKTPSGSIFFVLFRILSEYTKKTIKPLCHSCIVINTREPGQPQKVNKKLYLKLSSLIINV